MKELMEKLGLKEKKIELDVISGVDGFLGMKKMEDIELNRYEELSERKVYPRKAQKQVYELSELKKYAVAHSECGFCNMFYTSLSKSEVIKLVKENFNDYLEDNILVFESNDWISFARYTEKTIITDKESLVIDEKQTIVYPAGAKLSLTNHDEDAFLLYKEDALQIKELSSKESYLLVRLTENVGALGGRLWVDVDLSTTLAVIDEFIADYVGGNLLIFRSGVEVSLKEQFAQLIGEKNQKYTPNDESVNECRSQKSARQLDETCFCCGGDASKATWKDYLVFRGIVLELCEQVPLDGDGIYNCDSWFETAELKLKCLGVLKPEESLSDLMDEEFFTLAFSSEFPNKDEFMKYHGITDLSYGAICSQCGFSL